MESGKLGVPAKSDPRLREDRNVVQTGFRNAAVCEYRSGMTGRGCGVTSTKMSVPLHQGAPA